MRWPMRRSCVRALKGSTGVIGRQRVRSWYRTRKLMKGWVRSSGVCGRRGAAYDCGTAVCRKEHSRGDVIGWEAQVYEPSGEGNFAVPAAAPAQPGGLVRLGSRGV